ELVVRLRQMEVLPPESVFLSTIRSFDVDDLDHRLWHLLDADMSASLQHDAVSPLEQHVHQGVDLLLLERFAPCHLNQHRGIGLHSADHLFQRHFLASGVRVLRVAITATERASRQANEDTRLADVRGFALYREEDFSDAHWVENLA